MRLSEWRAAAPHMDAMSESVMQVLQPVVSGLGVGADAPFWVVWGEEPQSRYTLFAPTHAGLAVIAVRVRASMEGAHATGRLVRWSRVQIGDLSVEGQAGHHLLSAQLEGAIMRAVDAEADRMGAFLQSVFAGIDGRPIPGLDDVAAPAPTVNAG